MNLQIQAILLVAGLIVGLPLGGYVLWWIIFHDVAIHHYNMRSEDAWEKFRKARDKSGASK